MVIVAIILYILLNLYASDSGVKDAILWSLTGTKAFKWNEHLIFLAERILVCFCCIPALYLSWYYVMVVLAAFVFSFSFWHNGCYYTAYNFIMPHVYPKRFWDDSTTSTSVLEFKVIVRCILKLVSIILLIILL